MKKLLSILLIIMLIITFIQIRNMYALYKDEVSGEYVTSLGKWNVKVNGTDIVSPGEVVEFEIPNINIGYLDSDFKSTSAALVPNTEAFFDILLDTSNTEVAVKYIMELGEIDSYRVIKNSTGAYIKDTTDDTAVDVNGDGTIDDDEKKLQDTAEDDYDFALKYPIQFELLEITDTFGTYSLSQEADEVGLIVGTETESTYNKITKIDEENHILKGVIPVDVSQANLQDKVRVRFKWVMDEDTIPEENKEEYEKMYRYVVSRNNANESVRIQIPLKLKAIQYFGEDL